MPKFPDVHAQLTGEDGNAFFIIGRVSRALKLAGHRAEAEEFSKKACVLVDGFRDNPK